MKKIRILSALMVLVLCASMLLVACDKEEETVTYKLSDVMNADWSLDKTGVITSTKDASYVGEYAMADYNFVVTKFDPTTAGTTDAANSGIVTRVYNANTDQTVLTVTDSKVTDNTAQPAVTTTTKHYVDIISSEYFAVLTASTTLSSGSSVSMSNYFNCPLSTSWEYSLTIYNATGSSKETYVNSELLALCGGSFTSFDSVYGGTSSDALIYEYREVSSFLSESLHANNDFDLFAIGNKVYRFDDELKATLVKDYGLASKPSLSNMKKVGDSYLETVSSVYTVYDKDLKEVFNYTIPGYAEGTAYMLANGNLLVQYATQLDQNEKKFDVRYGADNKYELTTVLVTAEGATELEDVDYYIGAVKPSVAGRDGKKVYADTVENLAFIYPIGDNKMIDSSYANKKLVVLNNDGTIAGEVEVEGNIAEFPMQFTDDYYALKLSDGNYAIYDNQGSEVSVLTAAAMLAEKISGDYLLLGDAIYDANGSKVYDITDNHATVDACGNTVIIKKYSATAVSYGIFVDGSVKTIGTVAKDEKDSSINDFGFSEAGYYYTYNKEAKKYTYYNAEGNVIGTFDSRLTKRLSTDECVIMQDTAKKIFYKFSITK